MDFHELPRDQGRYDTAIIFVDHFGKRPISVPCCKTIDAKETAKIFIRCVFQYYGPPDTIVSDCGP